MQSSQTLQDDDSIGRTPSAFPRVIESIILDFVGAFDLSNLAEQAPPHNPADEKQGPREPSTIPFFSDKSARLPKLSFELAWEKRIDLIKRLFNDDDIKGIGIKSKSYQEIKDELKPYNAKSYYLRLMQQISLTFVRGMELIHPFEKTLNVLDDDELALLTAMHCEESTKQPTTFMSTFIINILNQLDFFMKEIERLESNHREVFTLLLGENDSRSILVGAGYLRGILVGTEGVLQFNQQKKQLYLRILRAHLRNPQPPPIGLTNRPNEKVLKLIFQNISDPEAFSRFLKMFDKRFFPLEPVLQFLVENGSASFLCVALECGIPFTACFPITPGTNNTVRDQVIKHYFTSDATTLDDCKKMFDAAVGDAKKTGELSSMLNKTFKQYTVEVIKKAKKDKEFLLLQDEKASWVSVALRAKEFNAARELIEAGAPLTDHIDYVEMFSQPFLSHDPSDAKSDSKTSHLHPFFPFFVSHLQKNQRTHQERQSSLFYIFRALCLTPKNNTTAAHIDFVIENFPEWVKSSLPNLFSNLPLSNFFYLMQKLKEKNIELTPKEKGKLLAAILKADTITDDDIAFAKELLQSGAELSPCPSFSRHAHVARKKDLFEFIVNLHQEEGLRWLEENVAPAPVLLDFAIKHGAINIALSLVAQDVAWKKAPNSKEPTYFGIAEALIDLPKKSEKTRALLMKEASDPAHLNKRIVSLLQQEHNKKDEEKKIIQQIEHEIRDNKPLSPEIIQGVIKKNIDQLLKLHRAEKQPGFFSFSSPRLSLLQNLIVIQQHLTSLKKQRALVVAQHNASHDRSSPSSSLR